HIPSASVTEACFCERGPMGSWHQIANATTTIAFSLALLFASQMYVASRSAAAGVKASSVAALRHAGYRAAHGR
ncbi:hypothetical protein ACSTIA_23890, partial [Vibrio parahaemolyticus]